MNWKLYTGMVSLCAVCAFGIPTYAANAQAPAADANPQQSTMPGHQGMMQNGMMKPGSGMQQMTQTGNTLHISIMHAELADAIRKQGTYSDKAFLSGMIAHHEAAVDMARMALKNSKNEQVRGWAENVMSDQTEEITTMSDMLRSRGGEDTKATAYMKQQMQRMMHGDSDPDLAFVDGMIGHHASAIYMAVDAVVGSKDDEVISLSKDIIEAQLDEIEELKDWLKKNKK